MRSAPIVIVRVRPSTRSAINPPPIRREINEAGVESEDRRRERLHRERSAIDMLEHAAEWTEPGDALDVSWVQQSVDHVEHEQRLHSVVGEALPRFGERQIAETARMPDKAAISGVVHGRLKLESRK
jgi:hypothetical protein